MGSLFRSEEIVLYQLFLQSDAAYACIAELGELGLVQFRDINPDVNAFQRKFVNEVRRCDEMERKLRFLEKEIRKDDIPMFNTVENPEAPQPREMIDLEATFEKLENELKEINQNAEALKKNFLELTELKHILQKAEVFFDEVGMFDEYSVSVSSHLSRSEVLDEEVYLLEEMVPYNLPTEKIRFVAGVILRERIPAFERMLWRACRGNVLLRQSEIEQPLKDPVTGDRVYKSVFIIFFQGEQLKTRVKKICEGFRATLFPCPETPAERSHMNSEVLLRLEDLNTVIGQTDDHRHRVLIAAAKNIKNWFIKMGKIKAIYHTLNLFNLDVTQKCLIAECWLPKADLEEIKLALRKGMELSGSTVPPILNKVESSELPPTYNRTNKFTYVFQQLVDAYGVATYREANPAPFSIITFPFLFAVMFGDAGHGLVMALFAAFMVIREKSLQAIKTNNEIWNIFFNGRYILLLMGLFSIYTGLIYNDFFSKSVNIFGSSWYVNYDKQSILNSKDLSLDPKGTDYYQTPYPFGIDPIWQQAENKIVFINSFKMKISVILGPVQMIFGIMLSLWNYRFFHKQIDIFCNFMPQLIFLVAFFGYLIILIFVKWVSYAANAADPNYLPKCAPSLLLTLISIVPITASPNPCTPIFPGQEELQYFLLAIIILCIPWMLLMKPLLFLFSKWTNIRKITNKLGGNANELLVNGLENPILIQEEEEFGELFIHQSIHTIEFFLGSISHTASYLRLWALSLAHAQLSDVLWTMVMRSGLNFNDWIGGIFLYIIFAAWAFLTVSILVVMEGLSAFLHTLRLHWVEFQSKFYVGDGNLFIPFSFDIVLENAQLSSY